MPTCDPARTRQKCARFYRREAEARVFSDGSSEITRRPPGLPHKGVERFPAERRHDGREINQMNGVFNFTYTFANGWTMGTQPNLSVDWKARGDDGVAFSVGPQIGKMCTCGGAPTLFQLQVEYYPVRPGVAGPTWSIQLQVTPTIPALIKKTLF
jgi:hypothetical protein